LDELPLGIDVIYNDPVMFSLPFKLMLPLRLIEPVLLVLETITSSIEGPLDPDFAMNTLPSVVFSANSPNCKLLFVGFWPDNALLRNFTICAICMDPSTSCGIYHD
jgi:hypothetical protein